MGFFAVWMEFFATRFEFFTWRAGFFAARVELRRVKAGAHVRAAEFCTTRMEHYAATVKIKQAALKFFAEPSKMNGGRVGAILWQVASCNRWVARG